jgi:hypothetical protein
MEHLKASRPAGIRVIVILLVIIGVLTLPMGLLGFYVEMGSAAGNRILLSVAMASLIGVLAFAAAFGVWRRARWSHVLSVMIFFVIGVHQLIVLMTPIVTTPNHVWSEIMASEVWGRLLLLSAFHAAHVVLSIAVIIYLVKPSTKEYFQHSR